MSENSAGGTDLSHILLAEDHALLRRLLEKYLVSAHFKVTAVDSGDRAREVLEAGAQVDLLLSDIRMPGSMDGIQLAQWVREHRPEVAIILQTGFADIESKDFTVLQKPCPPEELLLEISRKLQLRRTPA